MLGSKTNFTFQKSLRARQRFNKDLCLIQYVKQYFQCYINVVIALCRDLSTHHLDGKNLLWMGRKIRSKNGLQNHNCRYFQTFMPRNGCHCHSCVCSLFRIIKHISAGLCIHKLTCTCPPKKVWLLEIEHSNIK